MVRFQISPHFSHYDSGILVLVYLFIYSFINVCFPGITTHCGCSFHGPVAVFSLLVFEVFLITRNDVPQSVGILWTSDQSITETST
jgi:hypothetical protein